MTKDLKIIFPKETTLDKTKTLERDLKEFSYGLSDDKIFEEYRKMLTEGYSIAPTFKMPDDTSEEDEDDVFSIARKFTMSGIQYKATLKIKDKPSSYDIALAVSKLLDNYDFDYEVSAKLKINENSTVNFENSDSWFDPDNTEYKVNPKATTNDIREFKNIFDELTAMNVKAEIDLKTKVKKDVDELFETQLSNYPDGTLVIFKLKDADIDGE